MLFSQIRFDVFLAAISFLLLFKTIVAYREIQFFWLIKIQSFSLVNFGSITLWI